VVRQEQRRGNGLYLKDNSVLADPWRNPYVYSAPVRTEPAIYCLTARTGKKTGTEPPQMLTIGRGETKAELVGAVSPARSRTAELYASRLSRHALL
jgi:hypothetical protein